MYLELVDILRCPADHDPDALVASINRLDGRYIAEGSLGCPVCHARYPIHEFVTDFRVAPGESVPAATRDVPEPVAEDRPDRTRDDVTLQLAAMLDLRVAQARCALVGSWGRYAAELVLSYDAQCVLINPPASVRPGDGISIVLVGGRLPMRPEWASAVIDDDGVAAYGIEALAAIVRPGGRVIASVSQPLPSGLTELARDSRWWVAQKEAAAITQAPVALLHHRR